MLPKFKKCQRKGTQTSLLTWKTTANYENITALFCLGRSIPFFSSTLPIIAHYEASTFLLWFDSSCCLGTLKIVLSNHGDKYLNKSHKNIKMVTTQHSLEPLTWIFFTVNSVTVFTQVQFKFWEAFGESITGNTQRMFRAVDDITLAAISVNKVLQRPTYINIKTIGPISFSKTSVSILFHFGGIGVSDELTAWSGSFHYFLLSIDGLQ